MLDPAQITAITAGLTALAGGVIKLHDRRKQLSPGTVEHLAARLKQFDARIKEGNEAIAGLRSEFEEFREQTRQSNRHRKLEHSELLYQIQKLRNRFDGESS